MNEDDPNLTPETHAASGAAMAASAVRQHLHLVETCRECHRQWQDTPTTTRAAYLDFLKRAESHPAPRRVYRDDLPHELEPVMAEVGKDRKARRWASQQLSELRRTPRAGRVRKVRSATRRFRTRLLAELLLEEARATVRDDPREAESFAGLVPEVLAWAAEGPGQAWAHPLCALAEALRANALRVAGQLPAAERVFELLRHALVLRPVADAAVQGEIDSLEASLRIDQRRPEEAETLLRRAARAFAQAASPAGTAKARIKLANLMQAWERPADALELFESAGDALEGDAAPYLAVTIAAGRITTLCDLGRPAEARRVLRGSLDAFEEDGAAHAGAALRFFEGRVALGLGEHATAATRFATATRVMLELGRDYDGALAALYLAETYLAQGRLAELGRLAARLVQAFDERQVAGETVKAARLLAQATAAQQVSVDLLQRLRQRLVRAETPLHQPR